jgi:hypothetical protein
MRHAGFRGGSLNASFLSGRTGTSIVLAVTVFGAFAAPVLAAAAEVVPWPDRAETAARQFVEANAQQLANSIQRIAQPEGRQPQLTNLDFSKTGDRLLARIAVAWSDPSTRRGYAAWVYWEFGELGHVRAQVVSSSAPAKITAKNAALLEEHFREKIYPAVMRGIGSSELH